MELGDFSVELDAFRNIFKLSWSLEQLISQKVSCHISLCDCHLFFSLSSFSFSPGFLCYATLFHRRMEMCVCLCVGVRVCSTLSLMLHFHIV